MRISDWSSDVCSSDLIYRMSGKAPGHRFQDALASIVANDEAGAAFPDFAGAGVGLLLAPRLHRSANLINGRFVGDAVAHRGLRVRSERKDRKSTRLNSSH